MSHRTLLAPLTLEQRTHQNKLLVRNIAFLLRLARLMLRLSISEAEHLIGMKENTLWRFESGSQHSQIDTFNNIILAYRLPYSYIFRVFTTFPTTSDWRYLAQMQKQLNRFKKSDKKLKPGTGIQLMLEW